MQKALLKNAELAVTQRSAKEQQMKEKKQEQQKFELLRESRPAQVGLAYVCRVDACRADHVDDCRALRF